MVVTKIKCMYQLDFMRCFRINILLPKNSVSGWQAKQSQSIVELALH